MAEIRIERKQRGVLPWILSLALLALVVIGFALVLADRDAGRLEKEVEEAQEAGNLQEGKQEQPKKEDKTPRHLQQWVSIQESDAACAA